MFNGSFGWNPRNFRVTLNKPEVSLLRKFINFIRNFVFFQRNLSEVSHWMTCHLTSSKFDFFSLKSVGRLVQRAQASTLNPKILGSSPKQLKKEVQNSKVLPGEQKSESTFSRIQSGINTRNFGSTILRGILRYRNFEFEKKLPKFIPKFRLSGIRRFSRSFGQKWITVYHIYTDVYRKYMGYTVPQICVLGVVTYFSR